MVDIEQLFALAFHSERVATRRLALRDSISEEQALKIVLHTNAGAAGLAQLLQRRQIQANASIERLTAKRQKKTRDRALKIAQNQVPEGSWSAWFDGSARPNPGRCGIGIVLKGPQGERVDISRDVGHGDSSDAEYCALIATLELALQLHAVPLVVYGDSQVVIDDVSLDIAACSKLSEHRVRAHLLLSQLGTVRFCWVPRHKNGEADKLSQQASSELRYGLATIKRSD